MEIQTKTRRWGNSIAVIIPGHIVENQNIRENDDIVFRIEKSKPKADKVFGRFPHWKKSTQEMKDEMRKGWSSSSDRGI